MAAGGDQATGNAGEGQPAASRAAVQAAANDVVMHPLVMLSIVDHYNRVAKDTKKRVVGVLLGERYKRTIDVTNSFAVPFEEDLKDPRIWYLDQDYLKTMATMFRKVTSGEKIVGFYSSGPKIKHADIEIDGMFRKLCKDPLFVIVDVRPEVDGLPVQAYTSKEVVIEGKETQRVFEHVPSRVGAHEAEEVGVEHLLRDINDPSVSTLGAETRAKLGGLHGLERRLRTMRDYLERVGDGDLEPNQEILDNMQKMLNLLPNLNVETLSRALFSQTNDMHLAMYLSSLVRAVVALHDLATNKIRLRHLEEGEESRREAERKAAKAKKAQQAKKRAEAAAAGEQEGKDGDDGAAAAGGGAKQQ